MKLSSTLFLFIFLSPTSLLGCFSDFLKILLEPDYVEQPCIYKHSVINSIDEAALELAQANQDTLVIFDLDDTLLEPIDPIFQSRFHTRVDMTKKKELPELSFLKELSFFNQRHLVEPQIASIIKDLHHKHAPTFVLSAFSGGSYGNVKDIHEFRHQELIANNIDFDQPLPIDSQALSDELENKTWGKPFVALKHGILSCHRERKSFIVSLFIHHMQRRPNKVIFIDDDARNFFQFKETLEPLELLAISTYHYCAAHKENNTQQPESTIVQKQFELMIKRKCYVSYQEAEQEAKTLNIHAPQATDQPLATMTADQPHTST